MIDPRQDEIDRLARELQFEAEEKQRSPKQKKTNVLPFAGAAAEEEEKPSHAEILLLLEAMDDVEYDRCRRAKAREWGLQLATLDRMRKHAELRREYAQQQQKQGPQPDPNDLESRLRPILETEGILDLWLQSWDRVMAGEHRNATAAFSPWHFHASIVSSTSFETAMPALGGDMSHQLNNRHIVQIEISDEFALLVVLAPVAVDQSVAFDAGNDLREVPPQAGRPRPRVGG